MYLLIKRIAFFTKEFSKRDKTNNNKNHTYYICSIVPENYNS